MGLFFYDVNSLYINIEKNKLKILPNSFFELLDNNNFDIRAFENEFDFITKSKLSIKTKQFLYFF